MFETTNKLLYFFILNQKKIFESIRPANAPFWSKICYNVLLLIIIRQEKNHIGYFSRVYPRSGLRQHSEEMRSFDESPRIELQLSSCPWRVAA